MLPLPTKPRFPKGSRLPSHRPRALILFAVVYLGMLCLCSWNSHVLGGSYTLDEHPSRTNESKNSVWKLEYVIIQFAYA